MKVVNMGSTFLENYEKNLVQKAEQKAKKDSEKEYTKKLNEEKQNLAKKLKEDNIPPEKIIQYTGLSLNIIQKL